MLGSCSVFYFGNYYLQCVPGAERWEKMAPLPHFIPAVTSLIMSTGETKVRGVVWC